MGRQQRRSSQRSSNNNEHDGDDIGYIKLKHLVRGAEDGTCAVLKPPETRKYKAEEDENQWTKN